MLSHGFASRHLKAQTLTSRCLALLLVAAGSAPFAATQTTATFKIPCQFTNPTHGGGPTCRLIRDANGNLYGAGGGGADITQTSTVN
jgi:hypothetical protein